MSQPIEQLLTSPEGKTLEFKRDLSSPRNILKTLVAFANTACVRITSRPRGQSKASMFDWAPAAARRIGSW